MSTSEKTQPSAGTSKDSDSTQTQDAKKNTGRPKPKFKVSESFLNLKEKYDLIKVRAIEEPNDKVNSMWGNIMETVFELLKMSDAQQKEIAELKWKLARQENNHKTLSIAVSAEKTKGTVLVHGLSLHKDADDTKKNPETFEMTRDRIAELFKELEIPAVKVPIEECFRYTKPKDSKATPGGKKRGPETVQIQFATARAKASLYRALAEKKNKVVNVQDCIPKQLVARRSELEEHAYNLRKLSKKTKTRINYKNGDLELKVKEEGDNNFKVVKVEKKKKNEAKRKRPDESYSTPSDSKTLQRNQKSRKTQSTQSRKHLVDANLDEDDDEDESMVNLDGNVSLTFEEEIDNWPKPSPTSGYRFSLFDQFQRAESPENDE